MNLFDQIITRNGDVQKKYLEKQEAWVEGEKQVTLEAWKKSLGPHEWWKEDENPNPCPMLSLAATYSILCDVIISFIDDFDAHKKALETFFSVVEKLLENADEEAQSEVEIFLFETLLSAYSDKPELGEKFMGLLQPRSLLLCKRNEERWQKILEHKQMAIEHHYLSVERTT